MTLTGQLSDLSLAELIEFFCNQRKTGRLLVSYPRAPGFFYFQNGTIVDAKIGALNGVEAVYYALTLENASFDFNAAFEPGRRTIHQPWAQVALEGLRRMDEGIAPLDAFPTGNEASFLEDSEGSTEVIETSVDVCAEPIPVAKQIRKSTHADSMPLSLTVDHTSKSGRSMMVYVAVAAVVLLSIAAVGFPAGWYSKKKPQSVQQPLPVVNVGETSTAGESSSEPVASDAAVESSTPVDASTEPENDSAALAARRAREARARDHWKAAEEKPDPNSAKSGASSTTSTTPGEQAKKPEATKAKTTTVQVTYDESGRVTQASGGDANALRIARQKRFPPGKAGSSTVTIPVN